MDGPLLKAYLLENIWSKFLQFRFNIGVFQKLLRICEIKHIKLQFWKNGWINPFGSYKLVNIIKILKEKKKPFNDFENQNYFDLNKIFW